MLQLTEFYLSLYTIIQLIINKYGIINLIMSPLEYCNTNVFLFYINDDYFHCLQDIVSFSKKAC